MNTKNEIEVLKRYFEQEHFAIHDGSFSCMNILCSECYFSKDTGNAPGNCDLNKLNLNTICKELYPEKFI